jgi:hypothetical protein
VGGGGQPLASDAVLSPTWATVRLFLHVLAATV